MSIMDLTARAREFKELQLMIKELEAEAEGIKQTLISELEARNADTLTADIFTVKYITVKSNRIDTTALKKELPEVAARFNKESEGKRFSVS